jgi:acyl-CoA reductase-like NAD-dependent aldehyde dehydrogenase
MTPQGVTIRHPDKLFIGGEWVAATSGRQIEIVNPNSEEVVARVAEAGPDDMDRAVAAARAAFDHGPWPTTPPAERGAILMKMIDHLETRVPELSAAWTAQVGGLASFAPIMHGGGVAGLRGIAALGHSFAWVEQKKGMVVDTAVIAREPVGVVAGIAPWNAPFGIMANKVFYALVSGCTIVMKPSPGNPARAFIIAEAAEAGGPAAGHGQPRSRRARSVGSPGQQPGIDKVSFTGSTVGRQAHRRNLRRPHRSLHARARRQVGGDRARRLSDRGGRGHPRQHHHRDERAGLRDAEPRDRSEAPSRRARRGNRGRDEGDQDRPLGDPATQLGPLAMKRQLERVEMYIEEGRKSGADLVTGGQRPAHLNKGYYMEPTLFANVDNQSRIAQEEIFGPVLCLIPAEDEEDAIRIANESSYGLNGSVLTTDPQAAYDISRRIRTG